MIEKVFAQAASDDVIESPTLPDRIPAWDENLAELGERVWLYLLVIIGIAAFLSILYSGYQMITSAGDASKFAQAKSTLLYSLIGIIVIVLSGLIVRFALGLSNGL